MALYEVHKQLVGALWDRISSFFVLMWDGVWIGFQSVITWFKESVYVDLKKVWQDSDDMWWDMFLSHMKTTNFMTEEQLSFYGDLKNLPAIAGYPMLIIIAFITYSMQAKGVLGPAGILAEQKQNEITQPHLADVSSLIQSAFIAPEKTAEIRKLLLKHGLSEEAQDYMFLARYALYDINMCRDLFLRKVLSPEELFMRMRELGFTDTRTKEVIKTWELIPGPSDLFHLVGKEAFEPKMIEMQGLADEFPVEQIQWLEKQGLSKFWAEKYWYAHWEIPSVQMGFEMLHRKQIDLDQLDMLFRAQEIPPFWRDKLVGISYAPYTRVDTRRMFNFDVLSVEDVFESYQHQGYDAEHAFNLTKWTVAQKDPNNKDISQGQILGSYEDGILEKIDAINLLKDIGYTDVKAEFLIVAKDYDIAKKLQDKRLKIIEEKFTNRYINTFETLRQLSLLNLPYKQQQLLLEAWELDLLKDKKMPSKTDLEKFYLKGIINKDKYNEEMDKLGYNSAYVSWYRQLIDDKRNGDQNE